MKKNKQQTGSGTLMVLLGIILIAVMVGGGLYVLKAQLKVSAKDTATTTAGTGSGGSGTQASVASSGTAKAANPAPPSPGDAVYEDDYVKFSYPKDWKAAKADASTIGAGAYEVTLTSPVNATLKPSDPAVKNLRLGGTIYIAPGKLQDRPCRAASSCKLVEFTDLSPVSPIVNGGGLALTDRIDDGSQQSSAQLVDFTSKKFAKGELVTQNGLALNSKYIALIGADFKGDAATGADGKLIEQSEVKLAGASDFLKSKEYEQFKRIASTIQFKTDKLQ